MELSHNINTEHEYDECLTKGICSVNPSLSAIDEVVILYLRELAFYLIRLKKFGIENAGIRDIFYYAFFNIVTSAEYNQEQFQGLISKLYDYIFQSRALYEKHCLENNIEIEHKKSYFKYSKDFGISDAIRRGEKYYFKKVQSYSHEQKTIFDTMLFLLKSIVIKYLEYKKLGGQNDEAYYATLSLLDKMSIVDFSIVELKTEIDNFILVYYNIVRDVYNKQIELYGETSQVEVSFTPQIGKAILVSGSDLKKLELVLNACEGKEIGVYTHGLEMLMAHTFPKLRSHPNLKGHFGSGFESSLVDFASFPGPILMTRAVLHKVEYLYRGRLFTLDEIAPYGVVKIKNYDFEALIKSSLGAKGFSKPYHKPPLKVGYDSDFVLKKLDEIIDKINKNQIQKLIIVGLSNALNPLYKDYFDKFFDAVDDNCFVISLSQPVKKRNCLHFESFFDYSLFYLILKRLYEKTTIDKFNLSVFLTRCDKHTISNVLYLRHLGITNVYMCKCPPTLVNPSHIKTLQELFDIKEMSEPAVDLAKILSSGL